MKFVPIRRRQRWLRTGETASHHSCANAQECGQRERKSHAVRRV